MAYKLSKSKSEEYYNEVRSVALQVQELEFMDANKGIKQLFDEFDQSNAINADTCYGASAYLRSTLGLWGNTSMTSMTLNSNSLTCSGNNNEVCNSDLNLNSDSFFYDRDTLEVENIIRREKNSSMLLKASPHQASAVHPHMTLGMYVLCCICCVCCVLCLLCVVSVVCCVLPRIFEHSVNTIN